MGEGQGAMGDGQGAMGHREAAPSSNEPVCVAIDILDEDHSLRLAMRRLIRDAELRHALSVSGQRYWAATHSLATMVEDYRRIIPLAIARPAPELAVPAHTRANGDDTLTNVLGSLGVPSPMSGAKPRISSLSGAKPRISSMR